MRKRFQDLGQMQKWLKQAIGITVVAVGLQGSLQDLSTNMTSPKAIASAIQAAQIYSQCDTKRPCFVDYEPTDEDDPFPGLDYEQFIVAFVIKVRIARSRAVYGGLENLLNAIPDHEVLTCMDSPVRGPHVGYVLIRTPKNPLELSQLKASLHKTSVMFTIPDGSRQIHAGNTTFGNGLSPFNAAT